MDFGWFKNLFKKKNLSNTNTSDIATIDTSFIRVPKLSELSDQDRILVEKYLQELKYDNYESVLKYSDELLNKSNSEIEFFMINLDDILKDISSVINEVNSKNYFKLLLSKEEIKLSIDEFYKIIDETKLRLLALDTYIKKEELRKYDFLGIFGKAERLKYLNDKSKLLYERERLKTTIKISSQHLLAVFKALKEEDLLLNNMETYINSFKSFDINLCDYEICKKYALKLMEIKQTIDKDNCIDLSNLINICEENASIRINEEIKYLNYNKLIPYFAKENRTIKKYAYNHRFDYKKIIEEINGLAKQYKNIPSSKWDIIKLKDQIDKYVELTKNNIKICNRYLNDDVLKQIRESLFNLNYFYYISNDERKIDLGNNVKIPYEKEIINHGSYYQIFYNKKDIGDDGWDWDNKEEKEYYDKLSREMLKTVGILNLPLSDYKRLESKISQVVYQLMETGELHYLYDIYNNDFDAFNLNLNEYGYNNRAKKHSGISGIYEHFNLSKYMYIYNNIPLDEIYYLDIFLNKIGWISSEFNIDELFNDKYGFAQGMNKELFKLMIHSYFKNIDKQYDNRILIIPRLMKLNLNYFNLHYKQSIKDNNIAIYLSDWCQVDDIYRELKEEKTHIKYLMMTDDLYDYYKNVCVHDLEQKIIRVPNDTKYSELSTYLDQELAKDQEQSKVLSKRL